MFYRKFLPAFFRQLSLVALAFHSLSATAAAPPSESWTLTFRFENDMFSSTDRFYTNGAKLNWISPDLKWYEDLDWFREEGLAQDLARQFTSILPYRDDESRERKFSFSIGQMMYTPLDTAKTALITDDRPYAGWLYGSMAFHSRNYRVLDSFEIQAGMTGKWSLARQVQNLVHDLRNIPRPQGWDNQIATEPGLVLIYDHKYRLVPRINFSRRWGADAIFHAGGALGNIDTNVNTGIEIRAGWNLPTDFGTALIRPGGDTHAPADTLDMRYIDEVTYSAHIFMAVTGRAVLRNIFLDGNTFADSHSVDKHTLVGDFVLGASVVYRKLKIAYAHVFRTQEFKQQQTGHDFGSISISYTY